MDTYLEIILNQIKLRLMKIMCIEGIIKIIFTFIFRLLFPNIFQYIKSIAKS